ncbi:colanic acid/amylovoran biosynthesis glycosyltransferase [Tranquillimonas rosea]|uniref:Colanic acid/amylovoran biosynthesis glycosyltransferase n=1 Tax=Tranquillimonas rosea TaxID=641238 RepID=A0A1H9TFV1_9RHOB|nr:glycosyltransferase [Tranquillimonas rosea]SER95976.1 colanic acid/amylovoran biosynthesis glycosyltransferase [Tranquillimonas rosea]
MKICFSVSTFPARSQTFVTTQVLYAVRAGHEVTVACRDGEPMSVLSSETRAALRDVTLVTWPPAQPALLRGLPRRLGDRLRARLERRAWRRRVDADVVIAHFGYRGAAVARAQRDLRPHRPLVTVFHGRDVSVEHTRNGLAKYADLFAEGDLHLTVNAPFADLLVAGGAPPDRVATHHLGIPVARYDFTPRPTGTPMRLVAVCRLVAKKGLGVAIAALAELNARHPEIDWRFEIGGDGPLEPELRAQVAAAGLEERVSFLGPLSHEDTLERIAAADALVLPSVTAEDGDQEGIPVTLMEAMALGTPVCTTRHSGIPELVTHGESGLLADEGDVEALAGNIRALAEGRVDAVALAHAARAKVARDFDEDRQNAALLDRCAQVVARSKDPA